MSFTLGHHKAISKALFNFNSKYLADNKILFGGGTRIALELGEYRESVDIDFICPDRSSYRAVREQVTNTTLGALVSNDFNYIREVRPDRDAVRTAIEVDGVKIKLEFVSFDNYQLKPASNTGLFPVPYLDQMSCFYTKLLANADRKLSPPCKDIFDLLAMRKHWGAIPNEAVEHSATHYGLPTIVNGLTLALNDIMARPDYYRTAASGMGITDSLASELLGRWAAILLEESTNLQHRE